VMPDTPPWGLGRVPVSVIPSIITSKIRSLAGLGGALVGNVLAQWQDKSDKTKQDKSYKDGYNQAKVDMCNQNWDDNTGKGQQPQKQSVTVMVPKDKEDGVIYDQREITWRMINEKTINFNCFWFLRLLTLLMPLFLLIQPY
jgi:hypothetical protein